MSRADVTVFEDATAEVTYQGHTLHLGGYASIEEATRSATNTAKKLVHPLPGIRAAIAALVIGLLVTGTVWTLKPDVIKTRIETRTVTQQVTVSSQRLAGGNLFTCYTGPDGKGVTCPGMKTADNEKQPYQVKELDGKHITAIATDRDTACAAEDTNIWCWGSNADGQIDPENPKDGWTPPTKIEGIGTNNKVQLLTLGAKHACAAEDTNIWCWGSNKARQISADKKDTLQPTKIKITDISEIGWISSSGYVTYIQDKDHIRAFGTAGTAELEPDKTGYIAPQKVR